ncbi:probable trafficking protein particle complex subunit 2 isoform X4 [Ananas comosus]|uniref:Probable trafficking protein particle complex subunit 2 isoform X4 n=1 Tax=Ananas comosus TaxID=4615 RepID=A0A6P5ENF9_ANACO|nr:probable trafficking protein particle complex subunit 2 isoform X4 [Ananas comosus]
MTLSRLLRCAGVSTAIHRFYPVSVGNQQFVFWIMASTACFVIVSRNDIPIYEAEVGSVLKKEEAAHLHQFILHAALDIVQDLAWTTSAMFLKSVDRFNDLVVSVYVTAGHILR